MKLPAVLRTPPPRVAVEIGPSRVAAVAVAGASPAGVALAGWAVEPLPPGAVVPSLTASNVVNPAELEAALRRAWDRLGQHPKRVSLVIPDAAAKVSIVRFKDVPSKASDLDELVRFQIRKAAPFSIENSQVSFTAGDRTADGQDFVVVQARRDLILEYEQACANAGATAGIVDLATFGLAQCAISTGGGVTGDWLLIHAGAEGATIAIYRGRHPVFFRNRGASGDGQLGDLVHQTAMYYQDRLGGRGFSRVFAGGTTAAALASPVWTGIQDRLGVQAEVLLGAGGAMAVAARRMLEPETADAITPALGAALSLWAEG
jgi:type IV pilus assembly protein PilM